MYGNSLYIRSITRDVKSGARLGFRSGKIRYGSFQVDLTFRLESGWVQVRFRSGPFQVGFISGRVRFRSGSFQRGLYIHRWVSSLEALVAGNRHGRKVTGGCWNGGLG
ncbi:hypothetical protein GQ457_17G009580 [Hibiscus cannabinus]